MGLQSLRLDSNTKACQPSLNFKLFSKRLNSLLKCTTDSRKRVPVLSSCHLTRYQTVPGASIVRYKGLSYATPSFTRWAARGTTGPCRIHAVLRIHKLGSGDLLHSIFFVFLTVMCRGRSHSTSGFCRSLNPSHWRRHQWNNTNSKERPTIGGCIPRSIFPISWP